MNQSMAKRIAQLPKDGNIFIYTGANGSGKTRVLESLAKDALASIGSRSAGLSRLICLSGTVLDKFPIQKDLTDFYVYLGRKTNNNMFSEIAPYRNLFHFMIFHDEQWGNRAEVARDALFKIGLGATITFKFRRGRNTKGKLENKKEILDVDVVLEAERNVQYELQVERLQQLKDGVIHISGVCFQKGTAAYDIADLSSGERSYALTLLSLAFGMSNGSCLLYDEPENSLHPKWQASIVKDMWDVASKVAGSFKMIIATHSPLVVSGAPNKHTFTFDLERNKGWEHSTLYGNSSDSVLKEQFGLISARSISFINSLNYCLEKLVTIDQEPEGFKEAADSLFSLNVQLGEEDSLYATIQGIKAAREGLK